MNKPDFYSTLRIVLMYVFWGSLYILLSDHLLTALVKDINRITWLSVYKGWAFIFLSGTMIFFLLSRELKIRRQAEAASQQAEAKYRSIFENAVEGIFQTTPEGRFLSINPAMSRILGYDSPQEVILAYTDPPHQLYIDPQAREKILSRLEEKGQVLGFETQINKKDGTVIWVSITARAVKDTDGQVLFLEGTVGDITEHKQLANQFLQAQKMEAVGRLAGGLAHDFNNLLTAILGYAELMLMELSEDSPLRQYIAEIIKTTDHASSLTRQLLAFSRKQIMRLQTINLNTVITDMENIFRRILGEDVELFTLLDPALGAIQADPGQLGQVIMNLAMNSRDAMPRGGRLTIETENVNLDEAYASEHLEVIPGNYVMLTVSDTGMGMDGATQARIFEPFFTTKDSGKGTGLGLSTVYGIVKQTGGHIWVYSEPGQGTTFKIYLPQVEEAAVPIQPTPVPAESLKGQETILVVEDEESLRTVICKTLRSYGHTVLEAHHGGEAILISARHRGPIHLVLTDVVMPGINGLELIERLASLGRKMQVLFMSGYTEDIAALQGLSTAGAPFIEKPFKPTSLVQKVREVLGSSKQ
jgi:PAS domain S-box-containing protein